MNGFLHKYVYWLTSKLYPEPLILSSLLKIRQSNASCIFSWMKLWINFHSGEPCWTLVSLYSFFYSYNFKASTVFPRFIFLAWSPDQSGCFCHSDVKRDMENGHKVKKNVFTQGLNCPYVPIPCVFLTLRYCRVVLQCCQCSVLRPVLCYWPCVAAEHLKCSWVILGN